MTLASHANAALATGTTLWLPAHPAFLVVRRARHLDGSGPAGVDGWFEQVRAGKDPVFLADAGVDGDSVIATVTAAWRVETADGGLTLSPCESVDANLLEFEAATDLLRDSALAALEAAGGDAPPLWREAVHRALAILDSHGTGEELSDVAWPHFLLPAESPLRARRLAAAAATLWLWDGPGAWIGPAADRAHAPLGEAVADALIAAVDEAA